MERTVRYKEVLENKVLDDSFECFIEWNLFEVRKACLRRIERFEVGHHQADWAEKCVRSLQEFGTLDDLDLAFDVLSWYVFKAYQDNIAIRAIEFAISLSKKDNFLTNKISKIVAGRLKDTDICLYYEIPSLKPFLCKLLRSIARRILYGNYEYLNSDWYQSERAQRLILAAKDFSFLWKIDEIIMLLKEGCIYPWSYSPPDTKDIHLARLRITRKYLAKAKKEAEKRN